MAVGICTAICIALSLAAIISGCVFMGKHSEDKHFKYHLWWWVLVQVILLILSVIYLLIKEILLCAGLLGEPIGNKSNDVEKGAQKLLKKQAMFHITKTTATFDIILLLAWIGSLIWGIYIFAKVRGDGNPYAHQLWTWFQVNLWFGVACLALMSILLCCACCCGAIGSFLGINRK